MKLLMMKLLTMIMTNQRIMMTKGKKKKKQEQTTHTTATSTPVEEISAIHHILPSARDRKTNYSLHQYYRSEHKPGYKKINTFLLLQYKEEVLKFLQNLNSNANLKDVVYKYKDIVKHIENNTPRIQNVEKLLVMLKTTASLIDISDRALVKEAQKAYIDEYKKIKHTGTKVPDLSEILDDATDGGDVSYDR